MTSAIRRGSPAAQAIEDETVRTTEWCRKTMQTWRVGQLLSFTRAHLGLKIKQGTIALFLGCEPAFDRMHLVVDGAPSCYSIYFVECLSPIG